LFDGGAGPEKPKHRRIMSNITIPRRCCRNKNDCCGELHYHVRVEIPTFVPVVLELLVVEIPKILAIAIEPPWIGPSKVIPVVKLSHVIQVTIERVIIEMPKAVAVATELVVKTTTVLIICPCHPAKSKC
jgi:hypothetical protein